MFKNSSLLVFENVSLSFLEDFGIMSAIVEAKFVQPQKFGKNSTYLKSGKAITFY